MICVCIGRGRHKHTLAEHRYLAEQGVRLVELRVDYIRSQVNIKRLLADRPCPCIVTCRREQDGGQWTGTEQARQLVLRTAIVEGADYVDLEDDIAGSIPRFGKTKRIISYHNFRETPDDLEGIHRQMADYDPDIIKVATMAHRPSDNLRVLRLMRNAEIPTIGLCMGEVGTPTRILAGKFGAPFTYATFLHERQLAPGQLSFKQMREVFRYDSIRASTEVYGVVADPVTQNLNPVLLNAAFHHLKQNKVFVPFRVPPDELGSFMDSCSELGIKGLIVTVPHKEAIPRFLTQIDDAVRDVGTASTVVFERGGVVGYNTDYRAFLSCLDEVFPDVARERMMVGKTALVMGAGGLAKAIVYALKQREADVVITSRTHERAKELAEQLKARTAQWYERQKVETNLIVNATPIGMHPNVDESPYDPTILSRSTIVFDTVHNPEQTLLVKGARDVGCRVITGVDLFIRQAAQQCAHFTGQEPPLELMRTELKRAIGPAQA
jgi:3-dehydroquinate dehydratase/shikimate dehydrogenase